jgi:hypothetical protein
VGPEDGLNGRFKQLVGHWPRAVLARLAPRVQPHLNLATKPQPRAPAAAIEDGTGHISVAPLIQMNGVGMSHAEDLSDIMGVRKVVNVD